MGYLVTVQKSLSEYFKKSESSEAGSLSRKEELMAEA